MANIPLIESNAPSSVEIALEHSSLEASSSLLRQESSRSIRRLALTFDGRDNQQHIGFLTGSEILAFFRLMAECLPQLETLRLEWNLMLAQYHEQPPLVPVEALQVLFAETKVKSLTMYRIKLAGDGPDYARLTEAAIQNTSLQSVRIEFCAPVGSPNLDAFVLSLSKLTCLKNFEIIGFQGDETRGCTSTSLQKLGAPSMLRCLKLWGGILQNQDANAVSNLAQGLNASATVTDLEVGLFDLDASSSTALATLLKNNNSLKRVWLDVQNPLRKETASPLAEAMKVNTEITSFNLVSTTDEIVEDGVLEVFSDMVKTNFTLRHVTIRASNELAVANMNPSQAQHLQAEIEFYLKLNRVGRRGLLNSATKRFARFQWISVLGCESENVSIVFYLLSRNPTFISQCVATPVKCGKRQQLPPGPSSYQGRKRRRICID